MRRRKVAAIAAAAWLGAVALVWSGGCAATPPRYPGFRTDLLFLRSKPTAGSLRGHKTSGEISLGTELYIMRLTEPKGVSGPFSTQGISLAGVRGDWALILVEDPSSEVAQELKKGKGARFWVSAVGLGSE